MFESCLSANVQFFEANLPFFADYLLQDYFHPHFCHVTLTSNMVRRGRISRKGLKNRLLFLHLIRKVSHHYVRILISIFDVMVT